MHGGNAPQNLKAASRRIARQEIRYEAGQLGRALAEALDLEEVDPIDGLLETCRRAGALMRVYGHLVGELKIKPDFKMHELPDGNVVAYPISLEGWDQKGDQAVHVLMSEYRSAIQDYARVCKMALDTGIAAARVRVEQEKAQVLAATMQAVLRDLQLTPEQRALAPQLIRRHLLALDVVEAE